MSAKLKKRADRERKDNTLTFEELGVDQIFVDEADLYKNLCYTTKMNRIAGLPNSESNRAFDMYMKTRYLRERTGREASCSRPARRSRTPWPRCTRCCAISRRTCSTERGVEHFDAWAANFAEAVTALELAPDGSGYRMHTRFAKFINLPELLSMFRTVADVQTADMLNLPRPTLAGGSPVGIAAPATEALKAFVETLTERAEQLRTSASIHRWTTCSRSPATAARPRSTCAWLIRPVADPASDTKVNRAVDRILRDLGANPGRPIDPACFLRSLDARSRTVQRLSTKCATS